MTTKSDPSGDVTNQSTTRSSRRLMAQVAREHYLEGRSNTQIAEDLGVSRFKVARLLDRAQQEGIVKIDIIETGFPDNDLGERLRAFLGLERCLVVRTEGTEADVRRQVGAEAADLLSHTLKEGEVLGVSWGRTLTDTTSQLEMLPSLTIVQLTGFLGDNLQTSPIEVAQTVASRSGGRVFPLFVPLYVQDDRIAARLREHPDLERAMDLYPHVTTALLSVGSWDPPNTQVRDALPADIRDDALQAGCVADIAGILVGEDGKPIDPAFENRMLGIGYEQLTRVPRVVAVAAGAGKAEAVKAVARGGLVSEVVVDSELAEAILRGAVG